MSIRFRVCLVVWVVTVAGSLLTGTTQAEVFDTGDGWLIEVSPAMKVPPQNAVVVDTAPVVPEDSTAQEPADASEAVVHSIPNVAPSPGEEYRRIYESIPFNRAEYNANPSYRHDSTMEILTGNARHQTIVQHSTVPGARPRPERRLIPYRYNNRRSGLNYYFYFPYWNYRGIY